MISIAKAHAYGNDFLFVPHDQAEGLDPHELAAPSVHGTPVSAADGLILYTIAPDGTARMTLYNADGSPSELSGNGLRCLAALVLHMRRRHREPPPISQVRVETDAGWKTLTLVGATGGRYTFRAAMGQPTDVQQEDTRRRGRVAARDDARHGQSAVRDAGRRTARQARFNRLGPALATHRAIPGRHERRVCADRGPGALRILIWERASVRRTASGTGACAVGGGGDRAWWRRARYRRHLSRRDPARRVARRWRVSDRMGRSRVRRRVDRGCRASTASGAAEIYSPAEEAFNRRRRTVGLFLAPAIFLLVLALPLGLPPPRTAWRPMLGLVVVLWLTEALPLAVTAVLGPILAVVLQVTTGARRRWRPSPIRSFFCSSAASSWRRRCSCTASIDASPTRALSLAAVGHQRDAHPVRLRRGCAGCRCGSATPRPRR